VLGPVAEDLGPSPRLGPSQGCGQPKDDFVPIFRGFDRLATTRATDDLNLQLHDRTSREGFDGARLTPYWITISVPEKFCFSFLPTWPPCPEVSRGGPPGRGAGGSPARGARGDGGQR